MITLKIDSASILPKLDGYTSLCLFEILKQGQFDNQIYDDLKIDEDQKVAWAIAFGEYENAYNVITREIVFTVLQTTDRKIAEPFMVVNIDGSSAKLRKYKTYKDAVLSMYRKGMTVVEEKQYS